MTADHKASATTVQQRCPPLPANVPNNPPHDGANPAKPRQNPAIPPIPRTPPIEHVVRADAAAMPRIVVEQVGRRLPDALTQASGGLPEPARFHLPGDGFRLLQRPVPRFHGEHGLNASAAQSRFLGSTLASMSRSKCTLHRWQRAFGSSSFTAATSPAHRSPATSPTPFKPRAMMPVMNSRQLSTSSFMPSATASTSPAVHTDADGHQHARVLHAAAPAALAPYAVHEHARVIPLAVAPLVDVGIHLLELVAQGLGGHAVAPQEPAHVVDLAHGDAGQVHVDQRLPGRSPRAAGSVRSPQTRTPRP